MLGKNSNVSWLVIEHMLLFLMVKLYEVFNTCDAGVKERLQEANEQLSDGGTGDVSPQYDSPARARPFDMDDQPPTIEDTLDLLMRKLREKQEEASRPFELDVSFLLITLIYC